MEPHIFTLKEISLRIERLTKRMKTHILILAANHCTETDVPTETVAWLIGINLLHDTIFIHSDILGTADIEAFLAWLRLATPVANGRAAILARGNGPWSWALALAIGSRDTGRTRGLSNGRLAGGCRTFDAQVSSTSNRGSWNGPESAGLNRRRGSGTSRGGPGDRWSRCGSRLCG